MTNVTRRMLSFMVASGGRNSVRIVLQSFVILSGLPVAAKRQLTPEINHEDAKFAHARTRRLGCSPDFSLHRNAAG